MRRWMKRTMIGVFGVSMIAGGLAACSHHRYHGGWYAQMSDAERAELHAKMVDKASRRLDLDAAQKAKLAVLADTLSAQRKAIAGQGGDPRAELKAVLAGAQFDRSKAQALVDSKTTAVREGAPAVISAMADFYDSLKPDQQQKVRELLERRGGGHHRWHG
jgi:periplasmic protein CpxP/Spy